MRETVRRLFRRFLNRWRQKKIENMQEYLSLFKQFSSAIDQCENIEMAARFKRIDEMAFTTSSEILMETGLLLEQTQKEWKNKLAPEMTELGFHLMRESRRMFKTSY